MPDKLHPDVRGALYCLRAVLQGNTVPLELWEEALHLLLDRPGELVVRIAKELAEEEMGEL